MNERDYVRGLARQVAELASSPGNEAVKKRWRDVNSRRKPDRVPVYCRPIAAWYELLPEASLQCADSHLRDLERDFRRILIKHDIGDDDPIESTYCVEAAFDIDPPNTWGVDIGRHSSNTDGGAWAYSPPLRAEADFDRLRIPRYTYNAERTDAHANRLNDLIGDILPVRIRCGAPMDVSVSSRAADLRGLTEIMMDAIAEPALLHRLTAHVRDVTLAALDCMEDSGMLTPNNHGSLFESDPLGPDDGPVTLKNLWGTGNSQEMDQVSPAMWEEFCLAYQMPIFERFGAVAYGCCENLTHKIDGVLRIPNLRIFVCSAWTNLDTVIEKVGDRHTIMWRQKASAVVFPDDEAELKRDLDEGTAKLKGLHFQIVLRELQTLAGHPDRLHVWTRLAKEAAERVG